MPNDDLSRHKSKLRLNLKSTTFYLHAPTHNSNKEIKLASDSMPFSFHRNYICHANFKLGRSDIKCRKCGLEEENQEQLMSCSALSDNSLVSSNSDYQDINGSSTSKISHVGRILLSKYKKTTPCAQ